LMRKLRRNLKKKKKAKEKKQQPENKSEGSLPLTLTQKFDTEVDQGYERDGKFPNYVTASFEMLNRGESVLVINKWKAEYQRGKEWIECDILRRGRRTDRWRYDWEKDPTSSITINPKHPEMMSFSGGIQIKAKQGDSPPRRVHQSLPNPLFVRFTLIEVNGGSVQITVKHENEPIRYETQASAMKKRNGISDGETRVDIGYLQCDDLELETRLWIDCFRTDGSSYGRHYNIASHYTKTYVYEKNLNKLAYEAATEGKTEVPISEFTKFEDGLGMSTHMLIDKKLKRGYAFRFTLATNTGKTVRYFSMWPK